MRIRSERVWVWLILGTVLVTLLHGGWLMAIVRAVEPPRPLERVVSRGNGLDIDYSIHFDRNSLQDSIRLGDGLIALTSSGALLRFELPAVRLVRERIDTEEITCLGRGDGATVLAGLRDGRVCRVEPATLELTEVCKFPESPQWIGWGSARADRPAGLIVVIRQTRRFDHDGRRWDVPYSSVHDLATNKTFALEDEATSFFLDRAGRLWLGADRGEWGGRVTRVDLIGGTVLALKPPPSRTANIKAFWKGIYGFTELHDGQVWAFGGTSHMGFNSGEIVRIDGAEPARLFTVDWPDEPDKQPDPSKPRMPITQIIVEKNGLLVVSYSDVFRVNSTLHDWKKVCERGCPVLS